MKSIAIWISDMLETDITTVKKFIEYTRSELPCVLRGIPEGQNLSGIWNKIERYCGKMKITRPDWPQGYFKGWSTDEGVVVKTKGENSHHLFTIFYGNPFIIQLEPALLQLIDH